MPIYVDMPCVQLQDRTISVGLEPPTGVSGWTLQFLATRRFGGTSGLITKSAASGFNNVSGINVTNGPLGQFDVEIDSADTSGLAYGAYATKIQRLDSGSVTPLTEGFLLILP